MQVLTEIRELGGLPGPLYLAIGVFDGLHLGHIAVIAAARLAAEENGGTAIALTFSPHPAQLLAPEKAPLSLTSTEHKLKLIEECTGVSHALVIHFDRAFANLSSAEFVEALLEAAPSDGIAGICVGREWRFGKGRSGDLALLEQLGAKHGFHVEGVKLVEIDGERVSSTRVREAITVGDFVTATRLLGRPYEVLGTVVEGRRLGRTIGFPTANVAVYSEQLPPLGVYAVNVKGQGTQWLGVANLGYRPTVESGDSSLQLEAHLFGLDHEIYGEELAVEFSMRIRGEKKFENLDALKSQIAMDVAQAKEWFRTSKEALDKRITSRE